MGIHISTDGIVTFKIIPTINFGPWDFIISLTFNGVVYTQTILIEVWCKLVSINDSATIPPNNVHDLALGSSSFVDLPVLTNNCGSAV